MSSPGLPPGRGKELPVEQARRAKLQTLAKVIKDTMPPDTGFVLLAYGFGPVGTGQMLHYVSNSSREDVVQLLKEWLATVAVSDKDYARHIEQGTGANELAFQDWWLNRLRRNPEQVPPLPEGAQEWCRDAWNAGRASKL
jgi:hypothetical protein